MPFRRLDGKIGSRCDIVEFLVFLSVQYGGFRFKHFEVLVPGFNRVILIHTHGVEDGIPQFADLFGFRHIREHLGALKAQRSDTS